MGPLHGIKVIEVASIGPGPFAGMMLADMGAEVLRVERPMGGRPASRVMELLMRGRPRVAIDFKSPDGIACMLELCERADALIEGFRPGVMERLGLSPQVCLARNPRLVYGRMTGWGQEGPLSQAAGHDINYVALSGALHAIGRAGERPVVPLSLVGDFGGGGMLLAFGVACALLEAQRSGKGQVVDAAMVDGAALLMTMYFGMRAAGLHSEQRGTNLFDGGYPVYDTYETADAEHITIGPLEPEFYDELIAKLGFDPKELPPRLSREEWPTLRARFTERFKSKTRAEWCELLEGSDACFAPVLSMSEAAQHPHIRARGTLLEVGGILQPAPAPRFSRTPPAAPHPLAEDHVPIETTLARWGLGTAHVQALQSAGAIGEGARPRTGHGAADD